MSDFVTDNVGEAGGSMEETSAHPHHRVFLTMGHTHCMRHILERLSGKTVFWKWKGKKTCRQEIFLGKMRMGERINKWSYFNCVYVKEAIDDFYALTCHYEVNAYCTV